MVEATNEAGTKGVTAVKEKESRRDATRLVRNTYILLREASTTQDRCGVSGLINTCILSRSESS